MKQWKWYAHKSGNTYYAVRNDYAIRHVSIKMHRLILDAPKGKDVDHKDQNGLNNQKYNMRICTRSVNAQNQRARGRSKYLGVGYHKCIETRPQFKKNYESVGWVARIGVNYKRIFLGKYKREIDAAKAYNKAAVKYFGENAILNKVA